MCTGLQEEREGGCVGVLDKRDGWYYLKCAQQGLLLVQNGLKGPQVLIACRHKLLLLIPGELQHVLHTPYCVR